MEFTLLHTSPHTGTCHQADVPEARPFGPAVHDVHQEGLERLDVIIHHHLKLALAGDLSDCAGSLLHDGSCWLDVVTARIRFETQFFF
jgi:hypothetical protein